MRVSERGLIALASHEGIVVAPYKDVVGVWTYGVGHTSGAGAPDPAKMRKAMPDDVNVEVAKAVKLFAEDLKKYEDRVNRAVNVPLAQHEFDALVSFDFNTGGIFKAILTKKLNAGDKPGAAAAFMGWLRPEAIRGRRTAEMELFETGEYPRYKIPVYETDGNGNLGGMISRVAPNDLLAMLNATRPANLSPNAVSPAAKATLPPEVIDLINEADNKGSKTDLLNQITQTLSGMGLPVAAVLGFLQEVDWKVVVAGVAGFALVYAVSTYTRSSRCRKGDKAKAAMMALRAEGML